MRRRTWTTMRLGGGLAIAGLAGFGASAPQPAQARPVAPRAFCEAYPENPHCTGSLVTCETCHTSTDPVGWNAYGSDVFAALEGMPLEEGLAEAMRKIEDDDSDRDGVSNLDEILLGTNPGNPDSLWEPIPRPFAGNEHYRLGEYDVAFAYRRAITLYCGQSPDYDAMQDIRGLDDDAARERLHADLADCLDAQYWRTTGLRELADPKVKPIKAVGGDTEVTIQGFLITLADYDWDYRLWRYLMSDDRDMRDLLRAQYHVQEDPETGELSEREGKLPKPNPFALDGGQPLAPQHRAGMLTTQWFLMSNTMFSELPRTTAAQAYRAYLGMDISKNEGIFPVAGEPTDIDDKGVDEPACAQCHSTLDPLAYAFAYYEGIILEGGVTGTYSQERPVELMSNWEDVAHTAVLFGEEVPSVVEFGRMASESEPFRRSMTMTLYEHAFGREPWPDEAEAFNALVASIPEDGYSANRLIHRLVDTSAFGTP